jgi:death-on-curing protein
MHDQVVNSPDGAAPGVRDAGALEAAVARPYNAFEGVEFYPTLFAKAAALMESIIHRHPFVDGNKRTGLLAAVFTLDEAGYDLMAPQREQTDVPVAVAEHRLNVDALARWLENYARPRSTA